MSIEIIISICIAFIAGAWIWSADKNKDGGDPNQRKPMIKFMSRTWPLFLALDVILIPLVILWATHLDAVAAFLSRWWNWL